MVYIINKLLRIGIYLILYDLFFKIFLISKTEESEKNAISSNILDIENDGLKSSIPVRLRMQKRCLVDPYIEDSIKCSNSKKNKSNLTCSRCLTASFDFTANECLKEETVFMNENKYNQNYLIEHTLKEVNKTAYSSEVEMKKISENVFLNMEEDIDEENEDVINEILRNNLDQNMYTSEFVKDAVNFWHWLCDDSKILPDACIENILEDNTLPKPESQDVTTILEEDVHSTRMMPTTLSEEIIKKYISLDHNYHIFNKEFSRESKRSNALRNEAHKQFIDNDKLFFTSVMPIFHGILTLIKKIPENNDTKFVDNAELIMKKLNVFVKNFGFQTFREKDREGIFNILFYDAFKLSDEYSACSNENTIRILELSTFLKIYALHLGCFSRHRIIVETNYFKDKLKLLQSGKPLSGSINSIEDYLGLIKTTIYYLPSGWDRSRAFFKSSPYLGCVFNIYMDTDEIEKSFMEGVIQNIHDWSTNIMKSYMLYKGKFDDTWSDDLNITVKEYTLQHMEPFLNDVNKFLSYIETVQKNIKEKIEESFKGSRLLLLFIYYRLGALCIQRILFSSIGTQEIRFLIFSLKKFFTICESLLIKYNKVLNYHELKEEERKLLLEKGYLLNFVLFYLYTRMVYFYIFKIHKICNEILQFASNGTNNEHITSQKLLSFVKIKNTSIRKTIEKVECQLKDISVKRESIKNIFSLYSIMRDIEETKNKIIKISGHSTLKITETNQDQMKEEIEELLSHFDRANSLLGFKS